MKICITIVLTLFFALSVYAQKQAEVIVTSTFLRKLPDSGAEKVQTVQKGEKITFEKTQEKNGWYYVSISNGEVKGWIRKDTVRSVAKAETINQRSQNIVSTPTPIVSDTPIINATPAVSPTPNVVTSSAPAEVPAEEDTEVLRVDTEEISLNVRVVNNSNRPVSNLNQAHFEI